MVKLPVSERVSPEEKAALLDKLNDEHRELVEAGVYKVAPGQDYPLLRWARGNRKGQFVEGGGRPVNSNDIAQISRDTAYQRTNEYRRVLEKLVPASTDETKRGTFGWLVKQGMNAAEGGDVTKDFHCKECGAENTVVVWKRPDSNAIIKIMEMVAGQAPKQQDINLKAEHLYKLIDEREDAASIKVHAVDPHERARREALQLEDGEWRDVDDADDSA